LKRVTSVAFGVLYDKLCIKDPVEKGDKVDSMESTKMRAPRRAVDR
jgi:hypothetical protein